MAPVRQQTVAEEFLAIVCADDDLIRAEFAAIIAAGWDGAADEPPPARPPRPDPPGRPRQLVPARRPRPPEPPHRPGFGGWARQRSPPPAPPGPGRRRHPAAHRTDNPTDQEGR